MHIFIGGAYNGKREYVKQWLDGQEVKFKWFEESLPEVGKEAVVIAGIENWLAKSNLKEQHAIEYILERCANRQVVFILTDISRGIVPIDKNQRQLRDECGRLYQRLFSEANEITRIWYGIAQTLKGGHEHENLYENRG